MQGLGGQWGQLRTETDRTGQRVAPSPEVEYGVNGLQEFLESFMGVLFKDKR
jgi:hypothetical protein